MQSITFECEVITPMFLAGADGSTPELRPPSIKGALRFWWRALNGHLPIEEMREKEVKIFGGAIDDKAFKSNILVRIKNQKLNYSQDKFPNHRVSTYYRKNRIIETRNGERPMPDFKINVLDYLAFGISDRGNIGREYITPTSTFEVVLKPLKISEEDFKGVQEAFISLSQYGGLGAKSRNGFGCFRISNNDKTISIRKEAVKILSFTAISKETKVIYEDKNSHNSWDKALANIGKKYQKARETVEDWRNYDKRVLLTHPTIIQERGKSKEVNETILENGRHSKPYFLHIEKVEEGKFIGQILCMPYDFLKGTEFYSPERQEQYFTAIKDFNAKLKQ
ncbi:MAG: type III-B CRISPR module RAMP protein Cmr1 [Chitinophagales bacterium]